MESTLNASQIRKILETGLPYLKTSQQIWLNDTRYIEVDPENVRLKISKIIDPKLKHVHGEGWDCDNIAKKAKVVVDEWFLENRGGDKATAFGVANGLRFQGILENHTVNVMIFDQKVYLYDFQLDEYWQADPANDTVYKVEL